MAEFFTIGIIKTALEIGLIYALVAMALFISYSILNIADLSTDGSFPALFRAFAPLFCKQRSESRVFLPESL